MKEKVIEKLKEFGFHRKWRSKIFEDELKRRVMIEKTKGVMNQEMVDRALEWWNTLEDKQVQEIMVRAYLREVWW